MPERLLELLHIFCLSSYHQWLFTTEIFGYKYVINYLCLHKQFKTTDSKKMGDAVLMDNFTNADINVCKRLRLSSYDKTKVAIGFFCLLHFYFWERYDNFLTAVANTVITEQKLSLPKFYIFRSVLSTTHLFSYITTNSVRKLT